MYTYCMFFEMIYLYFFVTGVGADPTKPKCKKAKVLRKEMREKKLREKQMADGKSNEEVSNCDERRTTSEKNDGTDVDQVWKTNTYNTCTVMYNRVIASLKLMFFFVAKESSWISVEKSRAVAE